MNDILLVLLGAFLWRLRGGLLNDLTGKANWMGFDDTVVRAIWSIGMAWTFWFTRVGHPWLGEYFAVAHGIPDVVGHGLTGLAFFAGTTVIGWFGAALYPVTLRDVALLSLSGTLRMAFVAAILVNPWPLLAGVLCGPVYWLAAKIPHPRPWMFWGEWAFGAVIGLSLVLT